MAINSGADESFAVQITGDATGLTTATAQATQSIQAM